jgi:hypothetical protein
MSVTRVGRLWSPSVGKRICISELSHIGNLSKPKDGVRLTKVADGDIVSALRGIAQSGSAPALGAGCREFESLYPDHLRSAEANALRP